MTDAVKIALIGSIGTVLSGGLSVLVIILLKNLEVKVDGRLTELIAANKRADTAQGRQDERDSKEAS
jgi:hypothetical protein